MDMTHLLWQLALIIIAARILGEGISRLGYPAVLGEILAGLILGPSLLNAIQVTETLQLLGQIGVVMLLFGIGQGSDIQHLRKHGKAAFALASSGVLLPLGLTYAAGHYWLGWSSQTALLVGCTFTATSIGITLRTFRDLKQNDTRLGNTVLTAAILDDIMGVILLSLIYDYSAGGNINIAHALSVGSSIIVFFVLAPFAARTIAMLIRHMADTAHIPGLISTASLSFILIFAAIAEAIGAPALLGGFAAGIALSHHFMIPIDNETEAEDRFVEKVRHAMHPIEQLFTPIFFVVVGLSVDLRSIAWDSPALLWPVVMLSLIGISSKACAGLPLLGWPVRERWALGIAMMARGEVFLVFAELGRAAGLLDNTLYTSLILVMVIITLISPICLQWVLRKQIPSGGST
ncbi:MAG TPA: cation:proton antiporter [Pseudomonadales bacterium]